MGLIAIEKVALNIYLMFWQKLLYIDDEFDSLTIERTDLRIKKSFTGLRTQTSKSNTLSIPHQNETARQVSLNHEKSKRLTGIELSLKNREIK